MLPAILPKWVLWFRYADDIFCVWPITENVQSFLDKLNSLVIFINFTIEEEESCQLSFLDVLVHRNGRSFSFDL